MKSNRKHEDNEVRQVATQKIVPKEKIPVFSEAGSKRKEQ